MPQSALPPRTPYTFDRVVRIFFTTCIVVAIIVTLNMLKGVLLPFAVACVIAYLLEPIVKWNMRWTGLKKRLLSVALTLLETTILLIGLGIFLVPYVISETSQMAAMLKHYASTQIEIPYMLGHVHKFLRENIDFNEISQLLTREQWTELIKNTLSSGWHVFSSGLALIIGALSWLIVILYVFFIMLDYDRILRSFKMLIPFRHRDTALTIAKDIETAMNRYFRGQFLIAMLVGLLFSVGFLIIGLPMAIIFGIFIGILNLVPYLQLLSLPVAVMLCLVATASSGADFWAIALQCFCVYAVVQIIQDLILTPKIMGNAMGLNPAIILLSLSVWGALLGFMGLIIALPLTTLLIAYYSKYISNPPQL